MVKITYKAVLFTSLILGTLFFSCEKDEDIISKQPNIAVVDSTIPDGCLTKDGGSIIFRVEWSYTLWKVVIGDAIEGEKFITGASPDFEGSALECGVISEVKLSFRSNTKYVQNSQYVIIQSISDNISDTIVLTQEAKELVPINLTVDASLTYQTITGFGGANAIWGSDYLSASEMSLAFGTDNQSLGLSMFRVRLSSNKTDWANLVRTIKTANTYNVKVLASPWSPPAKWKSNSSVNGGGYLLEEYYDDYIAYINEFIQYMTDKGAHIDVVSLQNEPDWKVSYEGCEYTTTEMFNLVKNYAGAIKGAKVLGAESLNFNHKYTDNILNDPDAVNNLDIIGGHLYGSGLTRYSLAETKGKEIWMTEHLYNLNSGNHPENWTSTTSNSTIWNETMIMVQEIQKAMSYNWNAYIWWYIRRFYSFLGDGSNGSSKGEVLKRGYAISQFSKFIRPGYIRINAQLEDELSILTCTAYKGEQNIVVVIVNPASTSFSGIKINMKDQINTAKSYTTSLTKNRTEEVLEVTEQAVMLNIDANSVTTIVIE